MIGRFSVDNCDSTIVPPRYGTNQPTGIMMIVVVVVVVVVVVASYHSGVRWMNGKRGEGSVKWTMDRALVVGGGSVGVKGQWHHFGPYVMYSVMKSQVQ
jgi:hypothetical protein